jgi:hypothetical protein
MAYIAADCLGNPLATVCAILYGIVVPKFCESYACSQARTQVPPLLEGVSDGGVEFV